ncbi:MAG: tRNA epoxyqueuosine(34) reductase QueG, partial [Phenylobacterium sp.]
MTTSTSDIPVGDGPEDLIRAEASRLGFDTCRVADVTAAWPAGERLLEFVDAGRHGEMGWIDETKARRQHPQAMWG